MKSILFFGLFCTIIFADEAPDQQAINGIAKSIADTSTSYTACQPPDLIGYLGSRCSASNCGNFRVTVDADGYATSLFAAFFVLCFALECFAYLSNNKISVFPTDIFLLTKLKSLEVYWNTIQSIPLGISSLTDLTCLFHHGYVNTHQLLAS